MRRRGLLLAAALVVAACSGGDDPEIVTESAHVDAIDTDLAASIVPAMLAVDAELGPQEYFEVTASAQLVNLFVAVDDATAAVPYVWIDGELQPPAPRQEGASGRTFRLDDVEIDRGAIENRLADELPNTSINTFSVYGDGFGATYVLGGRSEAGGLLDIVITGDGAIVSVDPI